MSGALYIQEVVRPSLAYLILQHLSIVGYPIGPQEIASSIDRNEGSVRSRLSKMVSKGLVSRPCYGKYELTPRYGVGVHRGGLRVQNLLVVAEGVPVRRASSKLRRGEASKEVDVVLSSVSIHIRFGAKRGKVSYHVGAPLGLDPVGLELVQHIVEDKVAAEDYSIPSDRWVVEGVEILEDFRGFKLDGFEGATFWNLHGEMEKFYNKPGIRREGKLGTKGVSLNVLRALISEGVDAATIHRRLDGFEMELREIKEAQKGSNRIQLNTQRISQALLDTYIRREGGKNGAGENC